MKEVQLNYFFTNVFAICTYFKVNGSSKLNLKKKKEFLTNYFYVCQQKFYLLTEILKPIIKSSDFNSGKYKINTLNQNIFIRHQLLLMISSMPQKPEEFFNITFKQYDILFTFPSQKDSFLITLTNRFTTDTFSLKIDSKYIKQKQHLKHLYKNPEELLECIQGNKQTVIVDSAGFFKFQFKLFGPLKKGKQLIIQLQKGRSNYEEMIQLNKSLQKQIRTISLNYQLLQSKCRKIEDDYKSLGQKIIDLKTVSNTEQLAADNSLQLKNHFLNPKKPQKQTTSTSNLQIVHVSQDKNNPHRNFFYCTHEMGYIVVTHCKESQWHSYIKKQEITKSRSFQFALRGLSTRGAFIGICTEQYFTDKQPQMDYQNPYLISYQTSTGGIFHMTDTKYINHKCMKEDKVECLISLQNQKPSVSWKKNGVKIGESDIAQPLKGKPLHLAILMYQLNDKIKIKLN